MRYGVPEPSMLVSQRVFQNTSLPLKKARWTPASRAASTLARCAARPVLVVADRQERLVLEQLGAAAVGVDAGEVADVVAVALEPAHHRVLGVEQAVLELPLSAGRERAGCSSPCTARPGRRARRTGCCRRRCCRPARSCPTSGTAGRERAVVVAHDEDDVAGAARVRRARAWRSRCPRRRRPARPRRPTRPSCRSRQAGRRLGQARGLGLRQRGRWAAPSRPCARPSPP